jgi:hypothetical protein
VPNLCIKTLVSIAGAIDKGITPRAKARIPSIDLEQTVLGFTSLNPRFTITERPIRPVNEDHVDHDVIGADGQLRLQFVCYVSEKGKFGLLIVSDSAGHLD